MADFIFLDMDTESSENYGLFSIIKSDFLNKTLWSLKKPSQRF